MLLNGKVALVMGGASTMGPKIPRACAREGARVVVADVNEVGGDATVALIGSAARFKRLNTADPENHRTAVAFAMKQYYVLHVACNNAGISATVHRGRSWPEGAPPRMLRTTAVAVEADDLASAQSPVASGGAA